MSSHVGPWNTHWNPAPPTPTHTKAGYDTSKYERIQNQEIIIPGASDGVGSGAENSYRPEELWSWVPFQDWD